MAIALRGAASVPTGNPTTSFTVTVDAAVVANDLLFLTVTSRDSTGAGTLGVTDNDTGGNTWTKIGNSTDHKATLWYKRATSGTAGKTVTVSNAVGSASGVLKAFSGADTGTTPYTNIAVETNASADETHAGFTPSQADSMVCCSVHNYANDNAVTSLSFATLGATTATEKLSTGGSDCGCIFGHRIQTGAAAATGNLTWAQTDGTTYSIVWAIKPLASTPETITVTVGAMGANSGKAVSANSRVTVTARSVASPTGQPVSANSSIAITSRAMGAPTGQAFKLNEIFRVSAGALVAPVGQPVKANSIVSPTAASMPTAGQTVSTLGDEVLAITAAALALSGGSFVVRSLIVLTATGAAMTGRSFLTHELLTIAARAMPTAGQPVKADSAVTVTAAAPGAISGRAFKLNEVLRVATRSVGTVSGRVFNLIDGTATAVARVRRAGIGRGRR